MNGGAMQGLRVMIMAGGTGGHVYPALAVARHLADQGAQVTWLGTAQGLEARVVPEAGFALDFIPVRPVRGTGARARISALARMLQALWEALRVLRRRRPRVVLGLGGFASGPGGVAAWLLRLPLVIHDQNAVPGATNRILSHLAARVLTGFPEAFPGRANAVYTGNPVRAEICTLPVPELRFGGRRGPLRLLVLGGSQGAAALNETVPRALGLLEPELRPEVWHQTGRDQLDATRAAYGEAGLQARLEPFIEDMAEAWAWADLAVCRSGAITVSELAAAGLGAVLVPYPHAVDDHQTRNAGHLAAAGAARVMAQDNFTPRTLAEQLQELFSAGRKRLLRMAQAARRLARPDATEVVARVCLEVSHG